MGFSQADWQEYQINLDRIRFGNRIQPRERLNVPFQGVRSDVPQKPQRPTKERKPPPEPGYERFQLRLW